MRAPREIEELMWEVAEGGDQRTIDQFYSRYPEFADELEKRMQMVKTLRGSRPRKDVPSFVPRQSVRTLGPSRLAVAAVSLLVLASVTYATFAAMQFVNSQKTVRVEQPPEIVFNPPKFVQEDPRVDTSSVVEEYSAFQGPAVDERPEVPDIFMGKVTLQAEDISLSEAIVSIATQAGIEASIAPGFVDKRIRISCVEQPALSVLQELGQRFGFTAFKQGTIQLLIVPARSGDEVDAAGVPLKSNVSTAEAGSGNTKPKDDKEPDNEPPVN